MYIVIVNELIHGTHHPFICKSSAYSKVCYPVVFINSDVIIMFSQEPGDLDIVLLL